MKCQCSEAHADICRKDPYCAPPYCRVVERIAAPQVELAPEPTKVHSRTKDREAPAVAAPIDRNNP